MDQITQIGKAIPSLKSLRNMAPRAKRDFRWGIFFISPWIIGFLAFTLILLIGALVQFIQQAIEGRTFREIWPDC